MTVAAGLGQMSIHRNVIHLRFGNFILLETILVDAEISQESSFVNYNPCLECKLCVTACPVGAIAADGQIDFSACYTHNYREFRGGLSNWAEQILESKSKLKYRWRVSDSETSLMWQSLGFGPNYKAAYSMAVCPAGEDVVGPFLDDRKEFLKEVVNPPQEKEEALYVIPGSDAAAHATKRFPHKQRKQIGNGLQPASIASFLQNLPLLFQRNRSAGLNATFHFKFTGNERALATVVIREKQFRVENGHLGQPDLDVRADSQAWIGFHRKERRRLISSLIRGKIVHKGSPRLLLTLSRCFPS
jgi:ferredoxin